MPVQRIINFSRLTFPLRSALIFMKYLVKGVIHIIFRFHMLKIYHDLFKVVEEEIAPTEREEESEDSEKFEPPLQYKHFARFLAILRSYYSLCKVK